MERGYDLSSMPWSRKVVLGLGLGLVASLAVGTGLGRGSVGSPTAAATSDAASPFPVATRAKLDAAISEWLSDFKAPGVVVGIWIPAQGTYVAAQGVSDIATGTPMRGDEHFRVGSITKTFTVTALLQLVDEKKVKLDDSVSKYVSYVPNGKHITLRMLANMTSGLYSYTKDEDFANYVFAHPAVSFTPRQLLDIAFKHKPEFTPGTGFSYCNTNTVLLGVIIEDVTREPIAQVFADRFFEPLGLKNTSWPSGDALPDPYAHGITEQTTDGKQGDATHRNPTWGFTAGEIISNLDDLRVWVKSYTTGTLVSPAMQKARLTWVTFPPATAVKGYGLGIGFFNGWLGHTGELPGYNAGAFYLPSQDATIVIEVNSDIGHDGKNPVPVLFAKLATIVTPKNIPPE
jgi:D-alanyl-D-alanine carboxypeptidase